MKVYHKALVVAGLCTSMAAGLAGCGSSTLDGSKTVAAVGEKTVTLGEANFYLRYQQSMIESSYESMFGEGFFNVDLMGTGSTYGENVKEQVLTQLQEYNILEDKAADYGVELTDDDASKITEAAAAFLEANSEDTKEQMTADQETVERVLTLITVSTKTANAIAASADITVTDEEAAQRGFSYVMVSKGSGDEALTEEELQENRELLNAAAACVGDGETLDAAATEQGLTAQTGSYGKDNTSAYEEAVITALDAMSEGDVSEVIETDTALYLVQLTAELDEEATESRKEELLSSKRSDYYDELMESWKAEYPLEVETSVWADVKFNRSYVNAETEE